VNKDSYLILDTLPAGQSKSSQLHMYDPELTGPSLNPEYDSRVKAMEVEERPTGTYTDIGGLDKQIEELVEAMSVYLIAPMCSNGR
jgi:26S proteasome regulatory subunit T5